MDVHGFTEDGAINATIDGTRMLVPDTMANRHRALIAEWEASGNVIPPFVSPPPPIGTLTRRQARLGLLSIGITVEDVEAHIAAIADPADRAAALIEWQDATAYERDHPLVADLAAAFALPAAQVDALWLWAADI
ncbi:hypothetical protein [Shinella kummerowiae]|uniref:hypothetical protein n=1 Tax=Shinella kummerowiae TaxID=417745 RepID=UPI0021B674A9|nr:hypothetical protein [Shinella kummerowiae]MCT7668158.1 hypothetical protein [Shinella kummerowiae]